MNAPKKTSKTKGTQKRAKANLSLQLNQCQKEIERLKQELQEKHDKLLRTYADNQNLLKRMEKDLDKRDEEIKRRYLLELVDIKELLIHALDDSHPQKGIQSILRTLNIFFDKEHIVPIDCIGKPFDHNCHYALSTIEKEGCNEGDIVEEVKKGYFVKDRILRPSHVIVAQKKIQKEQEET